MAASIQNSSDGELLQIATAMAAAISADPAAFGLTAAYAAELTAKIDNFRSDINEQAAAMAKARSRTAAKNASRDDLEGYVCSGRNVAKAAGTPSAKIASLGLPVSSSKTPSSATVP